MELETDKILNVCAHRLEESNKVFEAMDKAETNIPAKMFLDKLIKDNQTFIDAARKRGKEIEDGAKKL